jgi:rhamnogalacturonyl hydrolase YesR
MKSRTAFFSLLLACLPASFAQAGEPPPDPLELSMRLAHSEMTRNGDDLSYGGYDSVSQRDAAWRYTTGLLAQALDDVFLAGGGDAYAAWARHTIDSYITDDGNIRTYKLNDFNIDKINSGKMLLRLYQRHGEEKYLQAAKRLRAQLEQHPRTTEGAFWHKKIYPWQIWLDGVYMGMPFLAHYSVLAGDEKAMEEAVQEFVIARRHLRDSASGLYYHGWDEKRQQDWADPETGLSSQFWSRGMGWYAMALVDVLDFLPADRSDLRQPLLDIIPELTDALLEHRHEGVWYQVTDRPDGPGNYLEASGSSMFTYMMAKAVNQGYLGPEYRDAVLDTWNAIVRQFVTMEDDGAINLNDICAVAGLGRGRDGSYEYYMSEPIISNEPKGTGPFIMAGIQIKEMMEKFPQQ